jgi:hypothetical protein
MFRAINVTDTAKATYLVYIPHAFYVVSGLRRFVNEIGVLLGF